MLTSLIVAVSKRQVEVLGRRQEPFLAGSGRHHDDSLYASHADNGFTSVHIRFAAHRDL